MSSPPATGDPTSSTTPPVSDTSTSTPTQGPSSPSSSSSPASSTTDTTSRTNNPPPSSTDTSTSTTSTSDTSTTDTTTTSDTSTTTTTSDTSVTTPPVSSPTDTSSTPPPTSDTSSSVTPTDTSSTAASTGSSTAATPTSTSSSVAPTTSTQTSTVIGTDANGSQYTSIFTTTVLSTPTISSSDNSSSSSSHTGAIVGGVVGGVVGAAILAALIFFICRRRRQRDDFDGNFDPDRVVGLSGDNRGTLPDIDLAADNITPYNYTPPGGGGQQGVGMPVPQPSPGGAPDMRQYPGQVPAFLAGGVAGGAAGAAMAHGAKSQEGRAASPPSSYSQPTTYYPQSTSDHGYPDYAAYASYANQHPSTSPTGSSPTNASFGPGVGVAAVPGRDFRHPSPGPSLAHTSYTGQTDPSVSGSSSAPGHIPSAKEREAFANRHGGNLAVANPDTAGAGPASSGVVQHTDGGRLDATPEDAEEPSEVPPRYDTIAHDR
ncbi:hypothetical protein L227DRAFT_609390 [Lentinus tigrinus ALCF2SS1-6]|uniref:Epidermal growth factor receptor-like transmembrane-juxtamembrane segment domain-containing protein n=1 Tax=Lentinus tigrinus ALCF2SS1-6 TaxID=1328759 RepID=A0A5C2SHV9_9APHY|nr:hypothetical protein L227DRAFT_609390 [Lentinus tigrinus ALCF2SS1-6]